ncbi:CBS domain-containing protein [Aquicella lusitana]|uniref:CBS domain protein n=1 Tax=Aquicella lusitana TaxID=254246 RepID=A0A370GH65_9COXI|nr:CBS domain-containing protein [Aquicella lusitana]RDI42586.1 CBS domain protein [Aquicella lusitana]VVC74364.1 Hypoxic response protein 1 [Aquicella lusitana]
MESRLSSLLQDKGYTIHLISPDVTVYECAKKMNLLGIGALLVMEDDKLIGIVSERDIIRKVISCNCEVGKFKVADIMTTELVTVTPSTSVAEAMQLVTEKRFRHLPVIENGKLIGIISIGDLTRWTMLAQKNEISSLTKYIHGDHHQ